MVGIGSSREVSDIVVAWVEESFEKLLLSLSCRLCTFDAGRTGVLKSAVTMVMKGRSSRCLGVDDLSPCDGCVVLSNEK